MDFQLVLFDLDNTLLRTDAIENFRGQAGLNPQPGYEANLRAQLHLVNAIYSYATLRDIHEKHPNLKFGVFTRAPRLYTQTLLQHFYPRIPWDTVVCFEDVQNTKPHPDGIWAAMRATGVEDTRRVVMVGDASNDIMAAYRAGAWAFLDRTSWRPDNPDRWRSVGAIADADFRNPLSLLPALENPSNALPRLEAINYSQDLNAVGRDIEINHFDNVDRRPMVRVEVLGRRFKECADFQYRYAWHPVSQQIVDLKDAQIFPPSWIAALRTTIRSTLAFAFSNNNVVTVIPAKPGRTPRLERLLAQLAQSHAVDPIFAPGMWAGGPNKLHFVPDQLHYLDGVRSHNQEHLSRDERMINVRDHLRVTPQRDVRGRHVMVIDDVTTSGATLLNAFHYLRAAGASSVILVSMTQAISPR